MPGLGHLLIRAVGDIDTSLAFAAVTVFSIFGVLLWRAAEWVERLRAALASEPARNLAAARRNDLTRGEPHDPTHSGSDGGVTACRSA